MLFFIALFLKARFPYSDLLPADIFLRFSPLIPLFSFIDTLHLSLLFWPALLILILTPFFGRFFCGWICPLGTSLDATSHLIHSPGNKKALASNTLRSLKFLLLFGAIILGIFSVNIWGWVDPLSLFNRALTVIFYPLFTVILGSLLLTLGKVGFLSGIVYPVYDGFKAVVMPEQQAHLLQTFWIALLILGIFAAEKLSRRFWCRNLCPAGAWLGFLSQFRFYERLVADSCPQCGKCNRECKMGAIPPDNAIQTNKVECIECFNCGATCPPKINAITYRWSWKPYHSQMDYSRRSFLNTTVGGLALAGVSGLGLTNRRTEADLLRPPGSLTEEEFLDTCIRCLECVRICQSNGRCLQPDGIGHSLLGLWTPVADMRAGYCEFNCNLCGEVCPTEAIQPLSLGTKQQTRMGLAYFDKNLCIPYARNEDCIVCEEHCPTPEKAIKFDMKTVVGQDGTERTVKYPYVDRELCIGCGICEFKCPLPNNPGIFVVNENVQRTSNQQNVV